MVLFGFILSMTPIIFVISLTFEDGDIWEAIKGTIFADLCIAMIGLGILITVDGGLLPL